MKNLLLKFKRFFYQTSMIFGVAPGYASRIADAGRQMARTIHSAPKKICLAGYSPVCNWMTRLSWLYFDDY